ncbi:MAG: asparagine synthase (glutamine-hydrolyzing) [Thermaerobacter sp.]|nr:asparagine synthase (glutamine-hydrolyzing) [Thermaerobacter sp.]
MCGICGIVPPPGDAVDPFVLGRMMQAMIHRGPDDAGQWVGGGQALGFRRLSILDLAGGRQPMANESGSVVSVVNGEIYNYRELRDELRRRGHRLHSNSDAEVVPHLFEEGGIAGLTARLRGMFALALVDRATETLYLVRDHFGIKPLYYSQSGGGLWFASEIKSLLASGRVKPELDLSSLWNYLSFQYVPEPGTMFAGIQKLPPAHYLAFRRGTASLTRYWQAAFRPDDRWTLPDLALAIEERLRDSVRRHMVSDVPRGAYLSSGIDSSAVVALLREREPVDTFSIGFSGRHGEINELSLAAQTAQQLGTRHHEVIVTAERYQAELPRIIRAQEDPIADPSAPALYFLAEEARRYVTVVLSGEGADELFAGYPIYHEPYALRPFAWLPAGMRAAVGRWALRLPPGLKGRGYLERGAEPLEHRFIGNAKMFSDPEKRALLTPAATARATPAAWELTAPYWAPTTGLDPVTRMQTVDCHTWLPGDILMKADKMSMAHSLELRVPFLDVQVFELAATVPERYKVAGGTTKYALREALRPLLPEPLASRPKLGFPIPIRRWIGHEMREFVRDQFASADVLYFNRAMLRDILEAEGPTVINRDRKLWTILVFLLWHRAFLEQPVRAERPECPAERV